VSNLLTADRLATMAEVLAKRVELRSLVERYGFEVAVLTEDGTLILPNAGPSYRRIARLAGEASRLVGAYVQVITDDVPAASVPTRPL
jgi:hypothetical protein